MFRIFLQIFGIGLGLGVFGFFQVCLALRSSATQELDNSNTFFTKNKHQVKSFILSQVPTTFQEIGNRDVTSFPRAIARSRAKKNKITKAHNSSGKVLKSVCTKNYHYSRLRLTCLPLTYLFFTESLDQRIQNLVCLGFSPAKDFESKCENVKESLVMLISLCYQHITKQADNESTECCGSRSRTGSVRKRTYV